MHIILMLVVVIVTVYLIIKKYQPHTVLLIAGLLLVSVAIVMNPETVFLPKGVKSTGSTVLDIFELIRGVMALRVAEIGLIIMSAGGFSKYMGHIGAADMMVAVAIKPLEKIGNPYIVLSFAYIIGQIINIFVPSAAGLAMLLLVAMYPILIRLGVTPAAAAAVIATSACLDLGPASGASNAAATWSGYTPVEYFFKHQVPVSMIVIPVIAVLHFFTQKYFDQKDGNLGELAKMETLKPLKKAPAIYAILPLIPLVLLLIFSKFFIDTIKMDVVTAMVISTLIAISFEAIRSRDLRLVSKDLMIFFKGMGELFSSVVSLIICAEIFATGFIAVGGVDTLISMGSEVGLPPFFMMVIMVMIIIFSTLLTGSGNASFYAFGKLAPDISKKIGINAIELVLPMQLSAGIARSISPVAGVVIICAGAANISPLDVVKRTLVPMCGGILATILTGWFLG